MGPLVRDCSTIPEPCTPKERREVDCRITNYQNKRTAVWAVLARELKLVSWRGFSTPRPPYSVGHPRCSWVWPDPPLELCPRHLHHWQPHHREHRRPRHWA